jgi:hypothetical protein
MIARDASLHLGAPGAITFDSNPNNGNYTVSWGAVPLATSYLVQEQANGGAWTTVYSGSATSASMSGKAGGSYVYQVQGCAQGTCGDWTGSATLGVWPAAPTNLAGPTVLSKRAPTSSSAETIKPLHFASFTTGAKRWARISKVWVPVCRCPPGGW